MKDMSYEARLKALNLESLELRRLKYDLCELYKMHRDPSSALKFEKFFTLSHNVRTRGHSLKLELPPCRGRSSHDTFKFRVVEKWNVLSDYTVTRPTLASFKNALDKEELSAQLRVFTMD
jgi:hypothetical protein